MEIVTFATGNIGKLASVTAAGHNYGISIDHYQPIPELLELQDPSYGKIAAFKAEQAAHQLGKSAFCIDGGFELDAYPGWPGSLTKPTLDALGAETIIWLVEQKRNWQAVIRNALAFCDPNCKQMSVFEDTIPGRLIPNPRGKVAEKIRWSTMWHYFIPDGFDLTLSEMDQSSELQAAWQEHRYSTHSIYHQFFPWVQLYNPKESQTG